MSGICESAAAVGTTFSEPFSHYQIHDLIVGHQSCCVVLIHFVGCSYHFRIMILGFAELVDSLLLIVVWLLMVEVSLMSPNFWMVDHLMLLLLLLGHLFVLLVAVLCLSSDDRFLL